MLEERKDQIVSMNQYKKMAADEIRKERKKLSKKRFRQEVNAVKKNMEKRDE